jgi:transcriptional regulator with XRE-family HTH domain
MLEAFGSKQPQYQPWIFAPFGCLGSGSTAIPESTAKAVWRAHQLPAEVIWLAQEEDLTGSALAWITWLWLSGKPATTASVEVRQPAVGEAAGALTHSPAEMLGAVRAHLSLSMVEAAAALEVERPTIYAWLAGRSEPQERNRKRLQRLFEVSRRWRRLSNSPLGARLRHPDEEGTSLLDLLRSGRFEEAEGRLDALAGIRAPSQVERKPRSIEEVLARHGLEERIRPSREEIDRLTGKHSDPE